MNDKTQEDAAKRSVNLVLISSKMFTGTDDATREGAVAVADGRIVWVGSPQELSDHVDVTDAEIVDVGDAFVMPGFHDAHVHFFHSALYDSPLAARFLGDNEQDAVARLKPLAQNRPDGWLLSQGWRDYLWDPPVPPTKESLDRVYPDRPVAMYSGDAHTLWLNSQALRELGIDEDSEPPAGGSYDKDADGNLTGIVREAAAMQLMPRIVASFSREELLDAYRAFMRKLASQGITAVCDVSLMALPGLDFVRDDLFADLLGNGELTTRVSLFPTLLDDTARLADMRRRFDDPLLAACGYKQFFDGVSSQHTAWLHEPYANARFDGDCGRPTVDPERMAALVARAQHEGEAVRIHAIGDEAIHRALDAFEAAERKSGTLPAGKAHTLEHLENFQRDDIARLARDGVIASVQPRHMTLDPGGPERDLGPERIPYMWPFRQLLDAGATLAFGTDSPVTETDPFAVLYTAVTRKDADTHEPEGGWLPEERITMAEALCAYTAGSARAAQRAGELGTIEPGMLADIVVLDTDLLDPRLLETPERILDTRVLRTIVGGRQVYEA